MIKRLYQRFQNWRSLFRYDLVLSETVEGTYVLFGGLYREHIYFYQNGFGRRRVKVTDKRLKKEPIVVEFLAGRGSYA